MGTTDDYFRQLTAEKLLTKMVKGYPRQEWQKVGPRNEALDCEVYAYAAAIRIGLDKINWDSIPESAGNGNQTKSQKGIISKGVDL